MTRQEHLEAHFGQSLEKIIADLHWAQAISIAELGRLSGVTRQTIVNLCRKHGLALRSHHAATLLTKNRGDRHWAKGLTKQTSTLYAWASERMKCENPSHHRQSAARMAIGRARNYRRKPWPQERAMAKMLERLKIPFEFQKPLGSYVIDFYIPSQRVALEVDSTERWGTQRRSRARWRDQELERLGIKTVRIDKRLLAKPERILEILSANDLI